MDVIEGGCNCGAVRYRLDAKPLAVIACHCSNCRRQSGSAFSVNLVTKAKALVIEGELGIYEDKDTQSGVPLRREFCVRCGSQIRSVPTNGTSLIVIKAGSVDDAGLFAPMMHIWTDSKLSWVEIPKGMPSFPKGPPG